MSVRVLIADDEELVRTGVRMILGAEDGIEVVGTAVDGADAVAATARLRPDVVLLDIRMPRMDGIEATRRIMADRGAASSVIVLTTFDLDEYVFAALRAGACGFLLKDSPADQLVAAVRVAAAGDALLAPSVTRRLIAEFTRTAPARGPVPGLDDLTPREREVLTLLARGLSNAEIAAELVLGPGTVKTHVARILGKLGVRDRVQAVVVAYRSGLAGSGPGQ